jgi:exopolysaccharide biosynthesis polyprenyl glycosylphosphotransferase
MHGRNLHFILILGTNRRAVGFARRIESTPELGYRIIGFVDDVWPGLATFSEGGFPLVSDFRGLPEFLRRNVVDEVAIFLPVGSFYKHSSDVVSLCKQHGIIMRFNSDVFDLKTTKCHAEEFAGDYYIVSGTAAVAGWRRVVKRCVDIFVALHVTLLLSPLLFMVALAIKLSSAGPVFFLQERLGVGKRRFRIIKFRTMVPDAEELMRELEQRNEASGPVFKIKNDPRINPFGKFLRRSSIDELPQLFNVLKGDMSLVGPRPLPVRDYEGFSEDWQRRRFSVKPGITCLWQVNGRSAISFHEWMLLDLQYMDEWSLWLDFKILARTVPAVLRGSGAA